MSQITKYSAYAVKAATATEAGSFTAIAAAYSVDRVGDRIAPGAFRASIERWRESGKTIPLHWDHQGDAKSIIGTVDPGSMKETEDGLYVEGALDLEGSEMARDAWRAIKSGSMSLSFGYLVSEQSKAEDGVTELKSVDLFEISVTPAPANADTRFLSLKSMSRDEIAAEVAELGDRIEEIREHLQDRPTPPPKGKGAEAKDPATGAEPKAADPEKSWFERIELEPLTSTTKE